MVWANKNIYTGQFLLGEKHGYGVFKGFNDELYEGEWYRNLRQGNC
jgi:MORN repeat.